MEQATDQVFFETESEFIIGKMRFLVTAHFDDTQDCMQDKIKHLLKNAAAQLP